MLSEVRVCGGNLSLVISSLTFSVRITTNDRIPEFSVLGIKESFVCVKNRNLKYSEKCGRNNGDDNALSACH